MFMQLELHLKINEDAKRKTFSTKNEKKVFPSEINFSRVGEQDRNMAINNNNSTSRSQLQTIINNPYAIRQEIQRFESVHPSIYAIYDLIELIPDIQVATQIREHIVNIEGESINLCVDENKPRK